MEFSGVMQNERESSIRFWNNKHTRYKRDEIKTDDWLEKFKDIIAGCQTPVIDLGCGSGNDTLYLIREGKKVISCDQSPNAIHNIKNNFPEVYDAKCFNMLDGLPFRDESCELVIADLCLHYFREKDTFKILNEIYRILTKNGHLLCRVNSMNDKNYGAGKGKAIENHLFVTGDNRCKRFFDEADIRHFLKEFELVLVREESLDRYGLEKILYSVCAKKSMR